MKLLRLGFATLIAALLALPVHAADDLSGARDFDFEFGDWKVHHRIKRASGEKTWDTNWIMEFVRAELPGK